MTMPSIFISYGNSCCRTWYNTMSVYHQRKAMTLVGQQAWFSSKNRASTISKPPRTKYPIYNQKLPGKLPTSFRLDKKRGILIDSRLFIDESLSSPDARVSAHHISAGYDLVSLRASFEARGCETASHEHLLLVESSPFFEQQACTAFFFKV
ncbi:hypothetical protein IE077_001901 [Cardiosporidium cionae]|uniref:Uncharacterized protein n=1 Tax=Cardiosporidium cionae TaxID=476202 RepID=A0ABQ7JGE9_9APIC|nr:hypothetical protein IE077_001901 [Cardiosporidium cionae]|eukprot:KAF8822944.1 hypothetical protein IE077_001901 [Cardiosporidium cionae]